MKLRVVSPAGLLVAAVLISACGGAAAGPRGAGEPSFAPAMTVERFLRATNQNDIDTMASLFGTRDGPVTRTWSRKEVDERMVVFSTVLRHSDYTIAGEQIVAGRREEATQLNVDLVINGRTIQVPFTLVRTRQANWLIEDIAIDRVTRSGAR